MYEKQIIKVVSFCIKVFNKGLKYYKQNQCVNKCFVAISSVKFKHFVKHFA